MKHLDRELEQVKQYWQAQWKELSGEGKQKSPSLQSHKRVESAAAPASLTATPQTEKEPTNNATPSLREIERLLEANQDEIDRLGEKYRRQIQPLDERIEELSEKDQKAGIRGLIQDIDRSSTRLKEEYSLKVAPLVKRGEELHSRGEQLELDILHFQSINSKEESPLMIT